MIYLVILKINAYYKVISCQQFIVFESLLILLDEICIIIFKWFS